MASQEESEANIKANKEFFDGFAKEYDERPRAIQRAQRTVAAIRKVYHLDENETTVMDFACGTGLVSRELASEVKRIVGVDVSQGMVDQFNARVYNQGIPPEEMQAFCLELKGTPSELNGERFDLIICASAYHHFTDIDAVTRTLAYFLKPGGTLAVVDLQNPSDPDLEKLEPSGEDDHSHEHGHGHGHDHEHHHGHKHAHEHTHGHGSTGDTIIPKDTKHVHHHNGMRKQQIVEAFEGAGLDAIAFKPAFSAIQFERKVQLFVATGRKTPQAV